MLDKWAQILVTCAVVTASLGLPVPAAHANEAPEPSKAQLLRDCEEGARLLEEKKLKDAEAYLRSAMDIDPPDYDAQLKYA